MPFILPFFIHISDTFILILPLSNKNPVGLPQWQLCPSSILNHHNIVGGHIALYLPQWERGRAKDRELDYVSEIKVVIW